MKDFLLEHYRQVNGRLTQSDRNRDVWVGAYLVLTVSSLSFAFSSDSSFLKLAIPAFLFCFGIFVAKYAMVARAWHCEYTRVLIAIHRSFLDGELNLLKAARNFKRSKKEFGHYFDRRGTEFTVFILILISLSFELVLLLWQAWNYSSLWSLQIRVPSYIVACILVFCIGIRKYKSYLTKREEEFPEHCYSIPKKPKTSSKT